MKNAHATATLEATVQPSEHDDYFAQCVAESEEVDQAKKQSRSTKRRPKPKRPVANGWRWAIPVVLVAISAIAAGFFIAEKMAPPPTPVAAVAQAQEAPRTKRIEDVRLGDRLAGRNPIRGQAELIEPDPATWRHVDLYMTKENGLGLWIGLLRPREWIEAHGAKPGSTIYIELYEMGAVGDAEVTYVGPCPEIQPGNDGTVVIGTFKHQADKDSNLVRLELEDQLERTGVTDNHPYWSVDRQAFVEVGDLRVGELVDSEYGLKHVVSVTPIEYSEFLYNVETTEHVYRVGSLGTLVHNSCATLHDIIPYSKRAPGFQKHHGLLNEWAVANKLPNYTKNGAPTIVMSAAEHNATRRVFGRWRYEKTGSINGAIDWTKVTPREMQSLSNRMLDAANMPQAVRDSYMQALNRFLYTGSF